ncbi:MAG: tail fiber domain-containing protein [Chitinophagaceae bacterium]|nr:tail fiber domain-containing protein [Chitinophagaceae bacterium]
MKNRTLIIALSLAFFFSVRSAFAQAPEKMSYQAIIRDASGSLLKSAPVGFRFSILQGSATGTAVYAETQTVTTNANGLAATAIGNGTVLSGTVEGIDWADGPYFVTTEIDPLGGTSYSINSTTQLLSVPYALFSKVSGRSLNDTLSWAKKGNAGTNADSNFIGTTDDENIVFRRNNVQSGILGDTNTAFGMAALKSNTDGYGNVAFGNNALTGNTSGFHNTAMGFNTLAANSTGAENIALGAEALFSNTKGSTNIGIGYRSLYMNDSGTYNISIGRNAMSLSSKGIDNIAVGSGALENNKGNRNIALGEKALSGNGNGSKNIAIGISSLTYNTSGGSNIAIGEQALTGNTTGDQNIAIGVAALQRNGSGGSNIAMGYQALQYSRAGSGNCAYGSGSLIYGETGSNNTAYGHMSLFNSNFGNYNTGIGSGADFNGGTAGLSNTICIGYNSGGISKVSNRTEIGNTSMSWIGGQVSWSTYSDRRIKKDIRENVPGLEFIKKLKPVTYHIDAHKQYQLLAANGKTDTAQWKEKYAIEDIVQTGFVAQDVAEAAKAVHYDFSGVQVPVNESELLSVRYADFVVPLVKAMQEQQALIEKLEQRIAELEKK